MPLFQNIFDLHENVGLLAETGSYEWLYMKTLCIKKGETKANSGYTYSRNDSENVDLFKLCFPKIPLNLLDEFNNPSKLADEISPVLSAR